MKHVLIALALLLSSSSYAQTAAQTPALTINATERATDILDAYTTIQARAAVAEQTVSLQTTTGTIDHVTRIERGQNGTLFLLTTPTYTTAVNIEDIRAFITKPSETSTTP